jgi:hypothetical protein
VYEKKLFFSRCGRPSGFDFNIPTALKGWVGHAPQGRGALLIIIILTFTLFF